MKGYQDLELSSVIFLPNLKHFSIYDIVYDANNYNGRTCGVMVIIVGNRYDDSSTNNGQGSLHINSC